MPLRFQLTDGQVVDAPQDCGCVHHTGPHWLHMDAVHKAANLAALNRMGGPANATARRRFAELELVRLRLKRLNFESHGICRVIPEGASDPENTPQTFQNSD